jgi:HEAT repeat protein
VKLLLLLVCPLILAAQNPSVINAHFEERTFSGDLASQLKSAAPSWFGYAIKTEMRSDEHCEGLINQPIKLEGSNEAAILLRVEDNRVQRLELRSLSCSFDAGGLPFTWLINVPARTSLAYLENIVAGETANHLADSAIFLISQHADSEALTYLIDRARNDKSSRIREQTLFWLAQKAGKRGAATITEAVKNDPDTEVKKRAVFALSQLPKDEAVTRLIEIASTQRNPEVRKQAFFWLGQTHDPRALAYIEQVLTK